MMARSTGGTAQGLGDSFLNLLPFDETAFERRPELKTEIQGWLPGEGWKFLDHEGWFREVNRDPEGKYVWAPPPAIADVALECLCEAKHAFPNTQHCYLCPALFTGRWRKTLGKVSDCMFSSPAGSPIWDRSEHEPLTFGFVCPLLASSPWQVRRLSTTRTWEETLQSLRWSTPSVLRDHMRKFWSQNEGDFNLPRSVPC